jgi:hypothetical protein
MDKIEDKWKDEVLGSLKGVKPAEPNPFLYSKIRKKINSQNPESEIQISRPYLSLATAALLLLLVVNVLVIKKNWTGAPDQFNATELEQEYVSGFDDNFNLYE